MLTVKVYWNLHRGCWSVMDARTRKILGHASQVLIHGAEFLVSDRVRDRVRATKRKEVHAFVKGELEAAIWNAQPADASLPHWDWKPMHNNFLRNVANQRGIAVIYNPHRDQGFREVASGTPVDNSPACYMTWVCAGSEDLTPRPRVMAYNPGCERNENIAA